jgi:hypothetical protein
MRLEGALFVCFGIAIVFIGGLWRRLVVRINRKISGGSTRWPAPGEGALAWGVRWFLLLAGTAVALRGLIAAIFAR